MEERSNLLEELAVLGFTEEKLREIQQKTERQEYDVLDVTLDLVYAVAPIKRAMRAERLAEKLALLTPQQRTLAEVILRNYVNDGVWTLSMKGFSDLLKQRYGSISEALSKLSFPTLDHALNYYSDIQHWLYAA
jgi:type I restriction enzyme R subunit